MEEVSVVTAVLLTLLLVFPLGYGLFLKKKGRLTAERICILMLVSGCILRLMYVVYTKDYQRQHDAGRFYKENSNHSGYIMYLMENHSLPDSDPRDHLQFYHPPLHHIISAVILSIVKAIGLDYIRLAPNVLQAVSAVYSSVFCILSYRIMKRIGLKDRALTAATAAVTFHPTLIILSGSFNNDMLSSLFAVTAILFTVRWAEKKSFGSIVAIAFAIGLGMLTKLTVGLLAPAVAAVFLVALIKEKNRKRLIAQFFVFGVICVPLGLCWSIRNYIKFGMPPGYVPKLSERSGQYIDVSPVKRLLDFSLHQFSSPFTQWEWNGAEYNEYNPVIALMKNAMFDEETFFYNSITMQSFCTALFFAGAVTAVLSAAAVVLMWRKREKLSLELKLLFTLTFAVVFINYLVFCIRYPQVCTENMRYCVPLIVSGSAALGLLIQNASDREKTNAVIYALAKTARISMTAMSVLSAFVYASKIFER